MTRFSVLLPTHNRRDTLPLAIESVLRQTISDFELLVVGDGCTDDTPAVVGRFGDSRIRWFDLPKAPNVGYANRNVALRQAEGELIAYACDDDLMLPDHLERLGKEFQDQTTEWVYSRPLWVSTDGIIVPFGTDLTLDDEFSEFLRGNTIPSACVMHRRECFELYGFWPEDALSTGDWQYWKRIVTPRNGRNIAYVRVPTTLHFSADWRQSRHAGVQFVATLLGLADTSVWWPSVLKAVIGAGQSEQSAIADALRQGGLHWCTSIRDAVDVVTNRNAWDSIKTYLPTAQRLEMEVRILDDQLRQRDVELTDLLARHDALVRVREHELAERDALLASRSSRLTAPLRWTRKLLAGKPLRL